MIPDSVLLLLAKATIVLLLALGVTRLMHRASAGARHLVWLVSLSSLLLVPGLTAWAPRPPSRGPSASPSTRSGCFRVIRMSWWRGAGPVGRNP